MAPPSRGGEERPSLPSQHPVPCTEVDPLGLLTPDHPEPTGVGGRWGRGCEVTARDCQQQRSERVVEAGEGDNSSGASG